MTTDFNQQVLHRLAELGLSLRESPPPPAGQYAPFRLHRGFGFLAAQTSGYDGAFLGRVGQELTLEQGQRAAERAARPSV